MCNIFVAFSISFEFLWSNSEEDSALPLLSDSVIKVLNNLCQFSVLYTYDDRVLHVIHSCGHNYANVAGIAVRCCLGFKLALCP
jgi:hypothetical protein